VVISVFGAKHTIASNKDRNVGIALYKGSAARIFGLIFTLTERYGQLVVDYD
jgi:hypothetical protein